MVLKNWDDLPLEMKNESVKSYFNDLKSKNTTLVLKRVFDIAASATLLVLLFPLILIISLIVIVDSKGPVIFKQVRVTQYSRHFEILKFRTMLQNSGQNMPLITARNDSRITKVGHILRKTKLDEIPQLVNILKGEMTFVGTRPEVIKYVKSYTDDMMATLLLPAGVTSNASIYLRDEENILAGSSDIDNLYLSKILPLKMAYNLEHLRNISIIGDFHIIFKTLIAVIGIGKTKLSPEMIDKDN